MNQPDHTAPRVVVHRDKTTLSDAGAARLVTALVDAVAERGLAHLVLTGGSMGSAILASVGSCPAVAAVDWSRVHLWWGDERYLPAGDPERNETQNTEALIGTLPIPDGNVHPVLGPDRSAGAEESAAAYATDLAEFASRGAGGVCVPEFDVVLLGVGPDGHIASLFPHHAGLDAEGTTAAVHDSPKPPSDRVTLTFDALRRGRRVWFIVSGADKADAVRRGTGSPDPQTTPASAVRGTEETLWLVDAEAASERADGLATG